jgi:hypothetical protein
MKTTLEQNKDIIICEYIQNADILKFSFPAYLSPEELRGKIEIVAHELSTNSHAPTSINVNSGDCGSVAITNGMSCASVSK